MLNHCTWLPSDDPMPILQALLLQASRSRLSNTVRFLTAQTTGARGVAFHSWITICPPCRTNVACGSAEFWCPLAPGSHKGLSSRVCGVQGGHALKLQNVGVSWHLGEQLGWSTGIIMSYHVYNPKSWDIIPTTSMVPYHLITGHLQVGIYIYIYIQYIYIYIYIYIS